MDAEEAEELRDAVEYNQRNHCFHCLQRASDALMAEPVDWANFERETLRPILDDSKPEFLSRTLETCAQPDFIERLRAALRADAARIMAPYR